MMSLKMSRDSETEKYFSPQDQQAKINEVKKMIGSVSNKLPELCSDASISRYLRARNWNTTKASKMLKQTLKWRLEYRPEKIRWEDIALEAETGKIYRANYFDKYGRTVLVMRPGYQNTKAVAGQIRFLVYSMENAIMNLCSDQEQMVWLIDFDRWTSSSTSIKATRETAHILQNHYPERLGLGIIYNPPKIFESFWKLVKPFIEPKTFKKVRFVYSNNQQSQKIMEETFDMDKLESAFGGRNSIGFDYEYYGQRMREDDKKISHLITSGCSSPPHQLPIMSDSQHQELLPSQVEPDDDHSDEARSSFSEEISPSDQTLLDDNASDPPCDEKEISTITATGKEIQISKLSSVNEC